MALYLTVMDSTTSQVKMSWSCPHSGMAHRQEFASIANHKSQSRDMEEMERATGEVIHIHSELNNRIGVGKSVCLSILT